MFPSSLRRPARAVPPGSFSRLHHGSGHPLFRLFFFLPVLLLAAPSGCTRDREPAPPARLEIPGDTVRLGIGEERHLEYTVFDSTGNILLAPGIRWSTGDSTVARVEEGTVRGSGAGETWIRGAVGPVEGRIRLRVEEGGGEPPPGTPRGYLTVDPDNPSWFRRTGEGPFFLCGPGDPEGFLYRGARRASGTRDGDQVALIEKVARSGANSIYLMAVRSHGGDGRDDENPFVAQDPGLGVNPAILDQWEGWFAAMDARGILIFFIFYDDGASVWRTGDQVEPPERAFIRVLVDRFEHHRNLVWVIGEEYAEAFSPARVSALARVVREADDFGHPVGVHQNSGLVFDFPDNPFVDQFALQWNPQVDPDEFHTALSEAFFQARGRYNLTMAERDGHGLEPTDRIRALNWAAALAGAYVMVYQWDVELTSEEQLRQCGYLARFMESSAFPTMTPSPGASAGQTRFLMSGTGPVFLGYSESGEGRPGVREVPRGTYEVSWLDARDGRTRQGTLVHAGGTLFLSRPEDLGPELAFYLRRVDAGPPHVP